MLSTITIFGESSSGLGALGVDGRALLIQLITFVLALWVLKRYAFKPIGKVLTERRELIESGVKIGEDMHKQQTKLETTINATLTEARTQADGIVAAAQDAARDTVREAETKARDKADAILTEAKQRTVQDVARARKQLESELVSLISDATEAIIEEKVDAKKDASLIDKALKGRLTA